MLCRGRARWCGRAGKMVRADPAALREWPELDAVEHDAATDTIAELPERYTDGTAMHWSHAAKWDAALGK